MDYKLSIEHSIKQLQLKIKQLEEDCKKLGNIIGECIALNHDDKTNLALKMCLLIPSDEKYELGMNDTLIFMKVGRKMYGEAFKCFINSQYRKLGVKNG